MNKIGRKELDVAIVMLNDANAICTRMSEEEQEKFDNMPENLQELRRLRLSLRTLTSSKR